jgi:hypothetical protein
MKIPVILWFYLAARMAQNWKRKTVPKDKIPQGIVLHVQENGWMDKMG